MAPSTRTTKRPANTQVETAPPRRAPKRIKTNVPPAPPPTAPPPPPSETLKTFATHLKEDPTKPSLLLDLPPELRNAVYEAVVASTSTHLSRSTTKRNLASTSALPRVNKQIRDEFLSTMWLFADIHTSAVAFSFRHIVAFLNRLSEREIKELPTVNRPAQRKITIELISDFWEHGDRYFLDRWLNRVGDGTRRGTDVRYEYVGSPLNDTSLVEAGPWFAAHHGSWKRAMGCRLEGLGAGREREELQRIYDALFGDGGLE